MVLVSGVSSNVTGVNYPPTHPQLLTLFNLNEICLHPYGGSTSNLPAVARTQIQLVFIVLYLPVVTILGCTIQVSSQYMQYNP